MTEGSMMSSARAFLHSSATIPAHMVPVVKTQATRDREAKQAYWMRFRFAERFLAGGGRDRPRGSTVRRMMRLLDSKGDARLGARILRDGKWVQPTKSRATRT